MKKQYITPETSFEPIIGEELLELASHYKTKVGGDNPPHLDNDDDDDDEIIYAH